MKTAYDIFTVVVDSGGFTAGGGGWQGCAPLQVLVKICARRDLF